MTAWKRKSWTASTHWHARQRQSLSRAELDEQAALRAEYIAEIRASFGAQLDHTVIVRPDGTKEHLPKKEYKTE